MSENIVGIAIPAPDARSVIASVVEAERVGVKAAWLTSGGDAGDALTTMAIAAAQTESITAGHFDNADVVSASDYGGATGADD